MIRGSLFLETVQAKMVYWRMNLADVAMGIDAQITYEVLERDKWLAGSLRDLSSIYVSLDNLAILELRLSNFCQLQVITFVVVLCWECAFGKRGAAELVLVKPPAFLQLPMEDWHIGLT